MFTRTVFDQRVLVSNLVAGAVPLGVLVAVGGGFFAFFVAIYVVLASLYLARAYGQPPRDRRRELVVWVTPWVGAVATAWLLLPYGWFVPLYAAIYVLPVYALWQLLALALRQGMARVSSGATGP